MNKFFSVFMSVLLLLGSMPSAWAKPRTSRKNPSSTSSTGTCLFPSDENQKKLIVGMLNNTSSEDWEKAKNVETLNAWLEKNPECKKKYRAHISNGTDTTMAACREVFDNLREKSGTPAICKAGNALIDTMKFRARTRNRRWDGTKYVRVEPEEGQGGGRGGGGGFNLTQVRREAERAQEEDKRKKQERKEALQNDEDWKGLVAAAERGEPALTNYMSEVITNPDFISTVRDQTLFAAFEVYAQKTNVGNIAKFLDHSYERVRFAAALAMARYAEKSYDTVKKTYATNHNPVNLNLSVEHREQMWNILVGKKRSTAQHYEHWSHVLERIYTNAKDLFDRTPAESASYKSSLVLAFAGGAGPAAGEVVLTAAGGTAAAAVTVVVVSGMVVYGIYDSYKPGYTGLTVDEKKKRRETVLSNNYDPNSSEGDQGIAAGSPEGEPPQPSNRGPNGPDSIPGSPQTKVLVRQPAGNKFPKGSGKEGGPQCRPASPSAASPPNVWTGKNWANDRLVGNINGTTMEKRVRELRQEINRIKGERTLTKSSTSKDFLREARELRKGGSLSRDGQETLSHLEQINKDVISKFPDPDGQFVKAIWDGKKWKPEIEVKIDPSGNVCQELKPWVIKQIDQTFCQGGNQWGVLDLGNGRAIRYLEVDGNHASRPHVHYEEVMNNGVNCNHSIDLDGLDLCSAIDPC